MNGVSIIVPTYNEKDNVERIITALFSILKGIDVIIVDDNSPDGTGQIADKLRKKHKNLHVIHRTGKRGLGGSIIDGLFHAKTPIIGVIDADFSHPPELIPKMIKEFDKGADFVIGSRYVKGGKIENWPFVRRLTSGVAVLFARLLTNVNDPVSGFFFIKKSIFDNVPISPISTKSWKVVLDLIVKSRAVKIVEIPYVFKDRREGKSKLDLKEYWHYILQVANLAKYKIFGRYR